MDLFEKYFTEIAAAQSPNTPWHGQMAQLVAAKNFLAYPEHRVRTLRYISRLLVGMNYIGEAYRAAVALPCEERGEDINRLVKLVEVDEILAKHLTFNLEIITLCNLRCPMCSHGANKEADNHRVYAAKGQVMKLDDFKKIWADIGPKVKLLVLVGQGETFMHPNIYEILDHVAPTPVYIDTNANIKLDAEKIVRSSLETLVFSIDGVDQRTYEQYRVGGNFQKAIENVKAVVAAKKKLGRGPTIRFKYIIFKHTEAYYPEAQKMADSLGVDAVQIVPCLADIAIERSLVHRFFPHGHLRSLSRIQSMDYGQGTINMSLSSESAHCVGAMNNPNIQVDGMVTPCCTSATQYMGNIFEQSFDDIWHSDAYREFRLTALRNRYENVACQRCSRNQTGLGRLFDGTELESGRNSLQASDDVFTLDDLRIDADYVAQLLKEGLQKDIDYYIDSGVLTPEAEILLRERGQG